MVEELYWVSITPTYKAVRLLVRWNVIIGQVCNPPSLTRLWIVNADGGGHLGTINGWGRMLSKYKKKLYWIENLLSLSGNSFFTGFTSLCTYIHNTRRIHNTIISNVHRYKRSYILKMIVALETEQQQKIHWLQYKHILGIPGENSNIKVTVYLKM